MHIRPFEWRDLPKLHAYRNETVYLHSALLLTNGPLQAWGAMLSSVLPTTGIDTLVAESSDAPETPLIGQIMHETGATYAHLAFAAPESALVPEALPLLNEALLKAAGRRGALRVLAETDETSPMLEVLRSSGYAIYTRFRIWKWNNTQVNRLPASEARRRWRVATTQDLFGIRLLVSNLTPGMVQQVEPVHLHPPRGLVYGSAADLEGYVELRYGIRGIWARPYIHPNAEAAAMELAVELQRLQGRYGRPVYVCVSAYQSWMDTSLQSNGAETGPRRALLARQLVVPHRKAHSLALPGFENQPETFAFSHVENEKRL